MVVIIVVLLVGCSKGEQIGEELEYIGKQKFLKGFWGTKFEYRIYFEDEDNRRYIYVKMSNYDWDNFDLKEGDKLKVSKKSDTKIEVLGEDRVFYIDKDFTR